MTGTRIITGLLLLLGFAELSAQEPVNSRFVNFGNRDGLTEKYIYSITQDQQGFIWVGTGTGLFRYDGFGFKPFRSPLDKSGSAISNILQAVYTDPKGYLWLGSLNDLQCYDPRSNRFWRPAYHDSLARKLGSYYVTRFTPAASGLYIHTSYQYFYRFNTADSGITDFARNYPATASRNTIKVTELNGSVYALHAEGIYRFNITGNFEAFFPLPFKDDEITNGNTGTGGILLTTFTHGLYVFNPGNGQYQVSAYNRPEFTRNNLFSLLERNQEIWLGSYPLFRCGISGPLSTYENKRLTEYELTANKIGDIFFDREGNLWISSHNGLSMMPWQNQQVQTLVLSDESSGSQIEPTGVYNLPGTRDLLIANTSTAGLVYYSAKENKLSVIPNPVEKEKQSRRISSLIFLQDGSVYASDDRHFFRFLPQQRQLQPVNLQDQDGKPVINAGRAITDRNGVVYISSINNGFYTWKPGEGRIIHYDKKAADPSADIRKDNILNPCLADSRGHTWFTSSTGVYENDPVTGKWTHYTGEGYPDIPAMTQTIYIAEDRQRHIWVTTQNNGLYEIYTDKEKAVIRNYGKNSGVGLNTDYCIKLKADKKNGYFWLSTINGLHRFDPVAKKIISSLTVQNGLARDGGSYSYNITDDNQLVVLYYGVASIIDLERYQFNDQPPPVELTSVRVMDKEYLYSGLTGKGLDLSYNQQFLQFEFAAIQYNNHNQLEYAYQLEGADKDWISSGSRNYVSYSGLGPGTYRFKVKAANNDGVWSTKETVLQITIHPPFWKTAWFMAVGAALIAAGLWLVYRLRMKAVRREEKLKAGFHQQMADMEMRALRAQMNPHFIFNSLNSIQKYILKNDHFAASQYLTRFSRMIRLILDQSNQNYILLSSETELLQLYCEMESLRFDQRFEYSILVDPPLNPDTVEIPSMLIQPYVENAIWHGLLHKDTVGKLQVNFTLGANGQLLVSVEDDGVGRAKAMELKSKQVLKKKSYGMQITEDRIALINRLNNIKASCRVTDLLDEQGKARGTRVELELPLKPVS